MCVVSFWGYRNCELLRVEQNCDPDKNPNIYGGPNSNNIRGVDQIVDLDTFEFFSNNMNSFGQTPGLQGIRYLKVRASGRR